MTYAIEFPDFDRASEAALLVAAGWRDKSWHNDAGPSFLAGGALLLIEYSDTAKRESDGPESYWINFLDHRGQMTEIPAMGFASLKAALGGLYEGLIGYNPFEDDPDQSQADIARIIVEYFAARDASE